ncbi:TIGR02270 family protein [Archangium gephyra]|uniref:TIGR02270 family protein n=1 Tax=Archangium gephyra TaxID=48 RepID=UPI0035D452A7
MHIDPTEPLWDIVEQHLDEAEFLWSMWERSLDAPDYTLDEVANGPEPRLLAHVDALVVNGPKVVERWLLPLLADAEAPSARVSAATLALLNGGFSSDGRIIHAALTNAETRHAAMIRALEVCECSDLDAYLRPLLSSSQVEAVIAAAQVLSLRGNALGRALAPLLSHPHPDVQALGLLAVVHEPPGLHTRTIIRAFDSPHSNVREAALLAGLALGLPEAWTYRRELGREDGAGSTLEVLALVGNAHDHEFLLEALQRPASRTKALWALGFVGTLSAAEACLAYLDDKKLAPLAGESFCAITGLDLASERLAIDEDEVPHTDDMSLADTEDEDLTLRPEHALPLPDAEGVRRWWMKQRGHFNSRTRYLRGVPLDFASVFSALREGPMRRRPPFSLGLWLRTRGRYTVNTRTFTKRQRAELTQLEILRERNLNVAAPLL